jgi:hypothetical protein
MLMERWVSLRHSMQMKDNSDRYGLEIVRYLKAAIRRRFAVSFARMRVSNRELGCLNVSCDCE